MVNIIPICLISFVILAIGSDAADKFNVLYTPDSLKFLGARSTFESLLKEIICACLGLSIDENTVWKGLYVTDPFNTPEAVVEVCLEGVSNVGVSTSYQTFPLTIDRNEPDVFEAVKRRIEQRYTSGGNKLLDVKLSDPKELTTKKFVSVLGDIKVSNVSEQGLTHLNYSIKEDQQFLNELERLKAITVKVLSGCIVPDNIVDFYNFRFSSLRPLINYHGMNSAQTKEAKGLLDKALQELSKAFVTAYSGSVLVCTIVTEMDEARRPIRSPAFHTKVMRDDVTTTTDTAAAAATEPITTTGSSGPGSNQSEEAENEDFAIVFNIMLWFGISYSFVLIAIVYGTMAMDPGRDTVIYRMTAPRIKKEL